MWKWKSLYSLHGEMWGFLGTLLKSKRRVADETVIVSQEWLEYIGLWNCPIYRANVEGLLAHRCRLTCGR